MYKSGSTSLVRNLNKHHILNLVRMNRSITAREISNETGLQMSTTLYTLKWLEKQNYIINKGFGNTTIVGGKPPSVWGINKNFGIIIGVEISSRELKIVVINFIGEVLFKEKSPLKHIQSHIVLVHQIVKKINMIIESNKIQPESILGIGVGMPGTVDHETGTIIFSKAFDYHSIRLKALLEKQLPYNILIDNDANAGAIGVNWLHSGFNKFRHILYICINIHYSGMGMGLIINGQIFRGAHSSAGETETLLNDTLLNRIINSAIKKYPKDKYILKLSKEFSAIKLSEVIEEALKGNNGTVFIIREIGKEISKNLISLVNIFDPELVVLGGDICYAESIIGQMIKERLKLGVVNEYSRNTEFYFSEHKEFTSAIGAAGLIYSQQFNMI